MYLTFSDIHLTDNPKHEYRWKFFDDMIRLSQKEKFEGIFILGDLSDRKDRHSSVLVNRISDKIKELSKNSIVYILKGNHDHPDGGVPYWEFLNNDSTVIYISKPMVIASSTIGQILCLPHEKDISSWDKNLIGKKWDYIFMHQTFNGALSSSNFKLEGVPLDLFNDTKIISGDIHVHQKIGNVTYIGSPYHIHFGDDYQGHYALLNEKGLRLVPYHTSRLLVINLTNTDDYATLLKVVNKNDFVRIRFNIPMSSMEEWQDHKEKIIEICKEKEIVVDSIEINIAEDTDILQTLGEVKEDMERTLSSDPDYIFEEYVKKENITSSFLLKIGRSLIKDPK